MKTPPYSKNRHENDGRGWPDRRESCGSCCRSPSLQGARCRIARRSSNLALLFAFLLNRGPRPDAHERHCRHRLPLGASQLTAVKAIVQFDLYARYLVMPCLGKWLAHIARVLSAVFIAFTVAP